MAARAGEHGDVEPVVGVELAESGEQRARGWHVDGVATLRAVDLDDEHRPLGAGVDGVTHRARMGVDW